MVRELALMMIGHRLHRGVNLDARSSIIDHSGFVLNVPANNNLLKVCCLSGCEIDGFPGGVTHDEQETTKVMEAVVKTKRSLFRGTGQIRGMS